MYLCGPEHPDIRRVLETGDHHRRISGKHPPRAVAEDDVFWRGHKKHRSKADSAPVWWGKVDSNHRSH